MSNSRAFQTKGPPRYEHGGRSLTAVEWGEVLGVSSSVFVRRIKQHGRGNPRAFLPNLHRRAERQRIECVAVHVDDDERVGGDERDARERAQRLASMLAEAPELRSHATRLEARATASVLIGQLGRMTFAEIGEVLGVGGERARQIATLALKKAKLAGGGDLRESWEAT